MQRKGHTILDARILDFGCKKLLPLGSFRNSNGASLNPNGVRTLSVEGSAKLSGFANIILCKPEYRLVGSSFLSCLATAWLRDFSSKSMGTAAAGFSNTWQNALEKNVNLPTPGQINLTT